MLRTCLALPWRILVSRPLAIAETTWYHGQIVHLNNDDKDKEWELGKLHKTKTKEAPAPTGGMTKVRQHYKFKNATRDQFFRLRLSEYGATNQWVALKKQRLG